MKSKTNFCNQKGFTLIELSVVLVVVSLIMVSIMVGRNIIENKVPDRVIADIKKINKAVDEFQELYHALPGDIADPSGGVTVGLLPSATPAAVPGNGNGQIESSESLHFWRHLAIANLYPGNFDGASTYITAKGTQAGGVPSGPVYQSGYKVGASSGGIYSDSGIYVDFSGYSAVSSSLGIISPQEAWAIDKKIDDGNPSTGIVVAFTGAGASSNCFNGSGYILSTTQPVCTLRFYLASKPITTTPASAVTCSGSALGATRQSSSISCAIGYQGRMVESCTDAGTWGSAKNFCNIATCGDGSVIGETRTLSCPDNYTGSVTMTCMSPGVWSLSNNCSAAIGGACTIGDTRNLACPLGQTGSKQQSCDSNSRTWGGATGTCTDLRCGASNIASIQASSQTCTFNGAVYNTDTAATNPVTESCIMPLTAAAVNNWRVTGSNCLPRYDACAGSGFRNIKCPPGQTGFHTQQCNGVTYQTVVNTCKPLTCGDEPIGAFRIARGRQCPAGQIGTVLEVCDYTNSGTMEAATWQVSTANCGQMYCPNLVAAAAPAGIIDGYANWNFGGALVAAGTKAVTSSSCCCFMTGTAIRDCGIDGTWQLPTQRCGPPTQIVIAPGATNFTVPEGFYNVNVKLWGAGAAGNAGTLVGGGGGAYVDINIPTVPGTTYTLLLGTGGGSSGASGGHTLLNATGYSISARGGSGSTGGTVTNDSGIVPLTSTNGGSASGGTGGNGMGPGGGTGQSGPACTGAGTTTANVIGAGGCARSGGHWGRGARGQANYTFF